MPFQTSPSLRDITIALTMGEPGGIGGELTLRSWINRNTNNTPTFFAIDNAARLKKIADDLGWIVDIKEIESPDQCIETFPHALPVLPVGDIAEYTLGIASPDTAPAVCRSIEMAVKMAMRGDIHALVTNPIQKNTLYEAGFEYPGHTEYIGHLSGGDEPIMMLASPDLRVVPLSIHESLIKAVTSISIETIVRKTKVVAESLRHDFNIPEPRLAVAGLNPHAGEDGTMGKEEQTIILPAIDELRAGGLKVTGPTPPDALFMARTRPTYDAAICHYHDQALIPIKALDVDRAVNVTIGLPIVRTSPDHGTALDIAGTGKAEPSSLITALRMAHDIARNRQSGRTS
jgi:4-hydroxythreonine-4-phosphate dehydrogenase